MYRRDFDRLEKIPNSLLFYGDKFFLDLYEEKITQKFKDENIIKIYFDEFDFDEVKSYLAQGSLFGEKNVIIYKTNKLSKNLEKLTSRENYFFVFYYGDKKPDLKIFRAMIPLWIINTLLLQINKRIFLPVIRFYFILTIYYIHK